MTIPILKTATPSLIASYLLSVQPLSKPSGNVYAMKTKYTRRIVDHVKVIKEGIMKYEDGSYIELYLLGVTSPYPIFAKVDHKNLEYKFLNFTCESHKIEGFHVLRDNVDIHSHIKEKPHWFI